MVSATVVRMLVAESLRHQCFHGLPYQLFALIAEHFLHLRIDEQDAASGVADHDRLGAVQRPRYRPSITTRCASASLRTLMSRMAAVTRIPSLLQRAQHDLDRKLLAVRTGPAARSQYRLLREQLQRQCAGPVGDQPFRKTLEE